LETYFLYNSAYICSRSSRIQDNELRDLAQKIRQENQLKERLENEQQSTVEEASVTTTDSSKLVVSVSFVLATFRRTLKTRFQFGFSSKNISL